MKVVRLLLSLGMGSVDVDAVGWCCCRVEGALERTHTPKPLLIYNSCPPIHPDCQPARTKVPLNAGAGAQCLSAGLLRV